MSGFTCPDCGDVELSAVRGGDLYACPCCGEEYDPEERHLSQVPDNADEWADARDKERCHD